MMTSGYSRRGFIGGLCAVGAMMGSATAAGKKRMDKRLTAFLADTHIAGHPERFPTQHQQGFLEEVVRQILAEPILPQRFVVFGDVARRHGGVDDYRRFLTVVKPLLDAGLEMTVTTGNHDNRAPMFEVFSRQRELTPVPGRLVSVTDLGGVDLILLDTLDDRPQADGTNRVVAALDKAQEEWMRSNLSSWPRPFMLGAHHTLAELRFTDGSRVSSFVAACALCKGYINGHRHVWGKDFAFVDYTKTRVLRTLTLSSTHLMDIGWAMCKVDTDRIVVENRAVDFIFPGVQPPEKRDPMWDVRKQETNRDKCVFVM
ncbi:MAG: hypothetical protein J6R80_05570 [Kiritimatiellae bacterium]|nr:hypothetical protein [Kiritimatiellia bacterium]